MIKLDYSLQSPEERKKIVEQILAEDPNPSPKYLEILADYLILCMEKQEKKERKLLTDNRMATINKREISFEGLVSQFENGEDGIYNLMIDNKHIIFQPKIMITKKDVEEIPLLRQLRDTIKIWEAKLKQAQGKEAFTIKRALIEMRKDQYIIKNAYRKPIISTKLAKPMNINKIEEEYTFDSRGYIAPDGKNLCNPAICQYILCNYSALRQCAWGNFESDLWFLLESFDKVASAAMQDYPLYERLIEYKVDGKQNIEIQKALYEEFNIKHSLEYISSLWRKKIPKLIASAAEDEYLDWYYLEIKKGKYKRCSRCGQVKLAHNKYFSKNKTSKDGFYSICKKCRSLKRK